jgi:glycosyltransferase involved in cell wall biosynthesis
MVRQPEPVLFLLSRVLGGKTFSSQIMRVVDSLENIEPHYVFFDEEDYARHRAQIPFLNRMAGMFLAPSILRWKLRENPPPPFRKIFVQSFELFPACDILDPQVPAILAHDSTNVLSYRLIRDTQPGAVSSLICGVKSALVKPAYRKALHRARVFLPRTHWCAGSLIRDFGVKPSSIIVAPGGLDTEVWSPPAEGRGNVVPRLLFVGNDFARKGGDLLLEVFSKRIYPKAVLRILSKDPALKDKVWPPGVEYLSGLGPAKTEALVDAYRTSDIFVFPTRKDHLGMALTEACAAGLPIIATDVGGIHEIVRDGRNGWLVPRTAGVDMWAMAILGLIEDKENRERFGRHSREIAETEFSFGTLRSRVEKAFETLA